MYYTINQLIDTLIEMANDEITQVQCANTPEGKDYHLEISQHYLDLASALLEYHRNGTVPQKLKIVS